MAHSGTSESAGSAPPWHASSPEQTLQALDSGPQVLSAAEAQRRLADYGANRLAEIEPPGALERLARQFNNLLLMVLMAAAPVTALMGALGRHRGHRGGGRAQCA